VIANAPKTPITDLTIGPVLDFWKVGAAAEVAPDGEEVVGVALEPNISGDHLIMGDSFKEDTD
jgi:hypothetical protein